MYHVLGAFIGFCMGFLYFLALRIRTNFIFKKRYIYYIGWIVSLIVFSLVFLQLNKLVSFDIIGFFIGILVAQIFVVSWIFVKTK